MAFLGKEPVPTKICVNGHILKRVNEYNYLGYILSFSVDPNISEKKLLNLINQSNKTLGITLCMMKMYMPSKHS